MSHPHSRGDSGDQTADGNNISDSSTDRALEIARELGAAVVNPDRLGYGYAYRYGFSHARGDYVVMGDADTTYTSRSFRSFSDSLTRETPI